MKKLFFKLLLAVLPIVSVAQNDDATKMKEIQAGIAQLAAEAPTNYSAFKGEKKDQSVSSTMYRVITPVKLGAQAQYINFYKLNGKSYYMAYYQLLKDELDLVFSAFVNMP